MGEREDQFNHEQITSADQSDVILVLPFYNESSNIPVFLSSLKKNPSPLDRVYLLGVDHRSNDQSAFVFQRDSMDVFTTGIVLESMDKPSVGIPRKKGLDIAYQLAQEQLNKNRKIVFGSVDIDTTVSPFFLVEAYSLLASNKDFLIFPTRNDQQKLLQCVGVQDDALARSKALQTLVGIEWLKYQFRGLLIKSGAIETRGSGGYFMTLEGYEKVQGHRPVYSADGSIITGESNAIGIRAKRQNATFTDSKYLNVANPRRFVKSIQQSCGSYIESDSGKVYTRTEEMKELPILITSNWETQYELLRRNALRTFVIKATAYGVIPQISERIMIPELLKLLTYSQFHCDVAEFKADEDVAIGSKPYLDIYARALNELNSEEVKNLFKNVDALIPSDDTLYYWANNTSFVINSADEI